MAILTKIRSSNIADSAITNTKIAAGAVSAANISNDSVTSDDLAPDIALTGASVTIPSVTTANLPGTAEGANASQTATAGMLVYNTTLNVIQQYAGGVWETIEPIPKITSISPTTQGGYTADVVVTGSGFLAGFTAKFIGNDATEYTPASIVFTSAVSITLRTPATGLPASNEPYDVKVTNPSGSTVTLANALDAGGVPAFTTSAGTLGTIINQLLSGYSLSTAVAVDPDANPITYSLSAGAMPAGLSFNTSTAAITGTATAVASNTTTNFTVAATTANSDVTSRAFSITVNAPIPVAFSYTGADQAWVVPAGVSSITVSMWGAAGGTDSLNYGFGGAGAYIKGTLAVTAGDDYKVVVGQGGIWTAQDGTPEKGTYGGGGNGNMAPSGGGLSGLFSGSGAVFDYTADATYVEDAQPVAAAWTSATDFTPNSSWTRDILIAGGGGGADYIAGGSDGGNGGGGATSLSGGAGMAANAAVNAAVAGRGGLGGKADGTIQAGQSGAVGARQGGGHLKGSDGYTLRWIVATLDLGGGGAGYMGGQSIAVITGGLSSIPYDGGGGGSSYYKTGTVTLNVTEGADGAADGTTASHGSSGLAYGAGDANRGGSAGSYPGQVSAWPGGNYGANGNNGRVVITY